MYKTQENLKVLTQMYSKFEQEFMKELTDCAVKIFGAKYEKADLPQIFRDTCIHLTESEK